MATPLHGAAARRQQRPQIELDTRKRKSVAENSEPAIPAAEESASTREKRVALQQMMMAGASPGGIAGRPSTVVVADAPITDVDSDQEAEDAIQEALPSIPLSPQEKAREIDVRIRLAEEDVIGKVINGQELLAFITLAHTNRSDERVVGMWQKADAQEKALSREAAGYFQYLLAISLGKFQENRRDFPTTNLAYQNAPDPVIIAGCKVELLKVIHQLYQHVNQLSQRYMQEKVLASQQASSRFEHMATQTLSKFPNELLPKVRETLEKGDNEEKARLRGLYLMSRPEIDKALETLYRFFSDDQNASFRPLFIDKYIAALHARYKSN